MRHQVGLRDPWPLIMRELVPRVGLMQLYMSHIHISLTGLHSLWLFGQHAPHRVLLSIASPCLQQIHLYSLTAYRGVPRSGLPSVVIFTLVSLIQEAASSQVGLDH